MILRYELFINVSPSGRFFFDGYQAGDPMVRGWVGEHELLAGTGSTYSNLDVIFARHNRDNRLLGPDLFGDTVLWRGWCSADGRRGGERTDVFTW